MEKEKIVLSSTQKGFMSQYFWDLFLVSVLVVIALGCSYYIQSVYTKTGVSSFSEFNKLGLSVQFYYWLIDFPIIHIVMYASYVIASIFTLSSLRAFFYSSREVSTFLKSNVSGNSWSKVLCEKYDFPFSKETRQVMFDRIVDITVEQPSISRILNTGTVKIKVITFTNADSKEQELTIPAIKKPYERKAELESAMFNQNGFNVKLQK